MVPSRSLAPKWSAVWAVALPSITQWLLHRKFIDGRLDRSLRRLVSPYCLLNAFYRCGREELLACFLAHSCRDIFNDDEFVVHLQRVSYFCFLHCFSLHPVASSS